MPLTVTTLVVLADRRQVDAFGRQRTSSLSRCTGTLRSVCRSSTARWRALSDSISAFRSAMSLICASRDLGLDELVARLLLRRQELQQQEGATMPAPTRAAAPRPAKKAALRRLRRSSRGRAAG
jgi:hypothetical protein